MQIYNSPSVQVIVVDYQLNGKQYRVVSPFVCFSLSSSNVVLPAEYLETIIKNYPNLIIDEGLPKLHGEWQIYGNAYRKASDLKHSFIKISLGESKKVVFADFENIESDKINLSSQESEKYFKLYEEDLSKVYQNTKVSFADLNQSDPNRINFFGDVTKDNYYCFPKNFSYEYSSVAPLDQRIKGSWQGDEKYFIQGVVPHCFGNCFNGQLPKVPINVYSIFYKEKSATKATLNLDTIKFFPDLNVGIMVWRGIYLVDPNKEIDMVMAVNLNDYSQDPEQQKIYNDQFFLKFGLDFLAPEQDPQAPIKQIQNQVKTIKKKSKSLIIARYCSVYNEYFDFDYSFKNIPQLLPLAKNVLSDAEKKDIADNFSYATSKITQQRKDYKDLLESDNNFKLMIDNKTLPSEKNFNRQVSSLLSRTNYKMNQLDVANLHKIRPLNSFSHNRFYLGFLDSSESHLYEDWGLDREGYFDLPKGIIVPEFFGEKFTSAAILPNGIFEPNNFFPIPGSEITSYVSWHNVLNTLFPCSVLVSDIEEGILLDEETFHYLNIIVMPDADSVLPKESLDFLGKSSFIVRIVSDEKYEEETLKWKNSYIKNVQLINLGKDKNNVSYKSLKDILLSNEMIFSDWFEQHYPFEIDEPKHIGSNEYLIAYDAMVSKLTGVKPHTFDFPSRVDEVVEEKRKEVLAICNTKKERETVNNLFDKTKSELKADNLKNDLALVEKSIANQKNNFKNSFQFLADNKEYQVDETKAIAFIDQKYNDFKQKYEENEKDIKGLTAHLQAMQERISGSPEEIAKRNNITAEEITMLRSEDSKNLSSIYITKQKWVGIDLSEMIFKDSTFDEVDFSNSTLSFSTFDNCTFVNCNFSNNHFPGIVFKNCTFTDTIFANAVAEKTVWSDCHFDFCNIDNIRFIEGEQKHLTCNVVSYNKVEWTKTVLSEFSCSFGNCNIVNFIDADINGMQFSATNFESLGLSSSHGKKLIFSKCQMPQTNMSSTVFERLEFSSCIMPKLKATKCHWKGLTIDKSNAEESFLSENVWDNVFIRESDFNASIFRNIVSKEATFSLSNLRNTDFYHANLFRADLSKSLLGGASFKEVNLYEADFTGVALKDNDFSQADLGRTLLEYLMV